MKRWYVVLPLALVAGLFACAQSQEQRDNQTVDQQQAIYARTQPVPKFDWSQDRDTLIQIYQLKNEARQTWSVVQSITGAPVWSCPSRGYPLAADTQLTNGVKQAYAGASFTVEQPEPNGVFSSKNTDATFVLCIRANGETVPVYTEQKVTTFPFAVRLENGTIVDAGEPATATVQIGRR